MRAAGSKYEIARAEKLGAATVFSSLLVLCFSLQVRADEPRIVVLDLENAFQGFDRVYFADQIRSTIRLEVPAFGIMTRENAVALLAANGKRLEDCEGNCEVETARLVQADYVVSGRFSRVGARAKLVLRLHRASDGKLVSDATASAHSAEDLDDHLAAAVKALIAPLAKVLGTAEPVGNSHAGRIDPPAPPMGTAVIMRTMSVTPNASLATILFRAGAIYRTSSPGKVVLDSAVLGTVPTDAVVPSGRYEIRHGNGGHFIVDLCHGTKYQLVMEGGSDASFGERTGDAFTVWPQVFMVPFGVPIAELFIDNVSYGRPATTVIIAPGVHQFQARDADARAASLTAQGTVILGLREGSSGLWLNDEIQHPLGR